MTAPDEELFDSLLRGVAASPRALLVGREVLGHRFRLLHRLGEGGFGVVYEAEDLRDGSRVALKLLRTADASWLSRFKREFRALQGLVHPNLIMLDELFGDAERWFFTMELIEGVDFVAHVTRGRVLGGSTDSTLLADGMSQAASVSCASAVRPTFDEKRLRDGLRQLMEGLVALHAAGRVHRDVKPSNVLVTHAGRVVLIDLGLVTDLSDRTESATIGTPAYMAPEQAAAHEVGPAADLYAVGVMLYELLTGSLPIQGTAVQMLMTKQTATPVPPTSLVPNVPEDLSTLCMQLLHYDPAVRPTTAEVCRLLAPADAPPAPLSSSWPAREAAVFVGRGQELATLRAALDVSRQGGSRTLLIRGESGIGKTQLIRHFMRQVAAEDPSTILLEGRCHEREAIPYKALDGIVEELARKLARMPAAEVNALLPTRRALLGTVFPSLLRIPQLAKLPRKSESAGIFDGELRQRAFLELRELFARVAMHRPMVVFIDDLQWADDDGLLALSQLLPGPEAPPLLFLGALRLGSEEAALRSERLQGLGIDDCDVLDILPLDEEQARELAAVLLAQPDAIQADPAQIAAHAGGHPLFVEELVRHVRTGPAYQQASLDDVIAERVRALEACARDVVELIAVSGAPLPQQVVALSAGLQAAAFQRQVAVLRACNLVRTNGKEWTDPIGPYHDRVREAVFAQLAPARRKKLHADLAQSLEAADQREPERLAFHWLGAGERLRSADHSLRAGDQAARMLAFDHAATWFQQALALFPEGDERASAVHMKLANALAFAGRGAQAADHFERAATDSPPTEALELRRRAAEQLLQSGHFERGVLAGRAVLHAIGMTLPRTRLHILVLLLYFNAWLRLRGFRFRERAPERLTAFEQTRIDTCSSMAMAVGFVEPAAGMVFQTRALLLALSAGHRERIACSLGLHAALSAMGGRRHWRRTARLLDRAHALGKHSNDPKVRVTMSAATGIALFNNARFGEAAEQIRRTLAMLRDGSMGLVHERFTACIFMVQLLGFLGQFKEQRNLLSEGLRESLAIQYVYGAVNLRIAFGEWTGLVIDQPQLAEREVQTALAQWPRHGYHLAHHNALLSRISIKLYSGDPEQGHVLASELLHCCRRSLMWGVQMVRFRVRYAHGGTALALLHLRCGDRAQLTRDVRRAARGIERERASWMRPFARVLRAGLAVNGHELAAACHELESAACEFSQQQLAAYAIAARYHAACLRADEASAAQIAGARAVLLAQDVVAPERMFAVLAPGFAA